MSIDSLVTDEMTQQFNDAFAELEKEQEAYWQSLTDDQRLNVFCAVSRRLYDGEIEHRTSYRGVLYEVFGFGPEAYVPAQVAGFLELHNAIFTKKQLVELLKEFAIEHNVSATDQQINDYILKRHL